jgi:katanin p60 ATPase-containing subunit A1
VDIDYLCKKTEFYSGADITVVCREASMMPLREHLKSRDMENLKDIKNLGEEPITMAHCKKALANIKPSVNKGTLEKYRKWMADFGCI